MSSAAAHGSAGGKRSGNCGGYPADQQDNQEHMGVIRRVAANPVDHGFCFLCGLLGIFRSLAGVVYPVSGLLCRRILLLDVPLLPPAGDGIGAGLGGLVQHINEVRVLKDVFHLTAGKQILDVLGDSSGNPAVLSEALPNLHGIDEMPSALCMCTYRG